MKRKTERRPLTERLVRESGLRIVSDERARLTRTLNRKERRGLRHGRPEDHGRNAFKGIVSAPQRFILTNLGRKARNEPTL